MDATHENEEWRPVIGFEGRYEVSDQGRVRSLDRITKNVHGKTGTEYEVRRKGRVLRPGAARTGHLHVVLGQTSTSLHRLVAEAFIGPRPVGLEIRHLNGRPSDCRAANLEYGTRSDNTEDSKRHGTHFHAGINVCKRGHDLTDPANLQKNANGRGRTCLACRRERAVLYKNGRQVTVEGFCINGHPKTPENRYTNGKRGTRCKICANRKAA